MARPGHRLITLAFSHYNEKARWALDWCGVEYVERRYLPLFSQVGVFVATRGRGGKADAVSSRWSTPVLVTADGQRLCDSTDIAQWASARVGGGGPGPLFPGPEVRALVMEMGRELGPYTRLLGYAYALPNVAAMRTLAEENVGRAQALAFRAMRPLIAGRIRRALKVDARRQARAMERVKVQLAAAEERLAHGPYLLGGAFTAADLTFASLLAPLLLVSRAEGYGATLPGIGQVGAEARAMVEEMRARPAGVFALEMYRRHRRGRFDGPGGSRG